MPAPAVLGALVVGAEIVASTSAIVAATTGGAVATAATTGAVVAVGTAGLAGGAVITAPVLVAAGAGFVILAAGSYVGDLAANMTSEAAEWAAKQLDPNDIDNVRKVEKSVAFGTFSARAGTFQAEDIFNQKYPFNPNEAILQSPFDNGTETADGKRTNKARIVGFWAVFVRVKEYDPTKVSSWRHSLPRANFGNLAFCFNDVVIQETSLHYALQIIPIPAVRMVTADSVAGELTAAVCNKIHGYLAPTVKAEISFIPVYECTGWTWSKTKPP